MWPATASGLAPASSSTRMFPIVDARAAASWRAVRSCAFRALRIAPRSSRSPSASASPGVRAATCRGVSSRASRPLGSTPPSRRSRTNAGSAPAASAVCRGPPPGAGLAVAPGPSRSARRIRSGVAVFQNAASQSLSHVGGRVAGTASRRRISSRDAAFSSTSCARGTSSGLMPRASTGRGKAPAATSAATAPARRRLAAS